MQERKQGIVIVSNRLPVTLEVAESGALHARPSAGGLVSALQSLPKRDNAWIGWTGSSIEPSAEARAALAAASLSSGFRMCPVFLSKEEISKFYLGFANEIVWPLFHDLQSRCNFDPSYWRAYQEVNAGFATQVLKMANTDDLVWIHDYQLMLVATHLRNAGMRNRLAYFHHIPFPSPDIFEKLPWGKQLLQGLLHHEVIGFQTDRDLQNFLSCYRKLLRGEVTAKGRLVELRCGGLHSVASAFPIGIDADAFETVAGGGAAGKRLAEIRETLGDCALILGVDRLDYTKGIIERLRAFEIFLEQHPGSHRKVTLVQVIVPSRSDVPKYQELKGEVERLVASINGRFTDLGWTPVQFMYRGLPHAELLAYYRAADVALVTPLKDGMNLVAKEFCACQLDRKGVLVLSKFAGAAQQLKAGALLVNPNDWQSVADSIGQALAMDAREKERRMKVLQRSVHKNNVSQWLDHISATVEMYSRTHAPEPRGELAAAVGF
jgi:trehalose 6-phosphate synthase/phosphatase